ncbi:hypothetical protein GOBAR_DD17407 [Gossypium barbadense]|nr:hypothetical protein GOBAR_DD17407 [Gossypium barbadense]
MSDIAQEAWRKYLIQLQVHPLRTKAITAGCLAGCSDLIAQKISGVKRIQLRRLLLIMGHLPQPKSKIISCNQGGVDFLL